MVTGSAAPGWERSVTCLDEVFHPGGNRMCPCPDRCGDASDRDRSAVVTGPDALAGTVSVAFLDEALAREATACVAPVSRTVPGP
ncbi:hypothetical protein JCM33774_49120 [Actinophytocola sp. KF-1]